MYVDFEYDTCRAMGVASQEHEVPLILVLERNFPTLATQRVASRRVPVDVMQHGLLAGINIQPQLATTQNTRSTCHKA
jgi:hypothetical protein